VGVGLVVGRVQPAKQFEVSTPDGPKSIFDAKKHANYLFEYKDDLDRSEYFVPVKWSQTVPLEKVIYEVGLFGNQNSVCQPTAAKWRSTVERLKVIFPRYNDSKQ
jgi:hypothetical protein